MEIPLLKDILVILGLGILVLFIFNRLRIPAIVGYLLTGMIAGPHGFALVAAVHEVEIMAEIGVILLLFTLGLEFSLRKLNQLKKAVFLGGFSQVILTITAAAFIVRVLGFPMQKSIFIGFLVALSSTAIVLKLLQEKAATDTPHGRTTIGILIFQDIIIVPMMLLTPLLAGSSQVEMSLVPFLVKLFLLLLFLYISQRWLVPSLLFQITRTRSRELFLMTVAFLAFSIAWITSQIGLSLALGAFLAGLIISESEYSHTAFATILPLRDLFLSFFFVSIGMLLNVRILSDQPIIILLGFLLIIILKFIFAGAAAFLLRFPFRTVLLVGLSLSQVGEFSFILSKVGRDYQLISGMDYQIFLGISILTMIATPFLMSTERMVDRFLSAFNWLQRIPHRFQKDEQTEEYGILKDHLIIIGFGLNGRNLSLAAQTTEIPYVVIDLNPDTIRQERKAGTPIFYGDATHVDVLHRAGTENARILVIAINDAPAARLITSMARKENSNLYIIVRTRFLKEVNELYRLGADEVIPEEFETSVEIFTRVLKKYLIPEDQIAEFISEIRKGGYEILRNLDTRPYSLPHFRLSDMEVQTLSIPVDSSFAGKSLAELNLNQNFKTIVLVLVRNEEIYSPVDPKIILEVGDELIVFGKPAQLARLMETI